MANFERFKIELPTELAQFVHSQVGEGALASDADVVREAVRQAAQRDAYRDEMRQKIAAGFASLRPGKDVDGDAFMAELDADLAEQERQGR
jgi:putative addiction module CopG family antidote